MRRVNAADHSAAHSSLCREIARYLTACGAWTANIAGGSRYQRAGLPDYLGFVRSGVGVPIFFAIEAKTGSGTLTKEQKAVRAEIEQAGGIYVLARSTDDVQSRFHAEGLTRLELLV